jgi:hypothetical protein
METVRLLAERDPANTQWQTDVVVSCYNLAPLLFSDPGRRSEGKRLLGNELAMRKLQAPSMTCK